VDNFGKYYNTDTDLLKGADSTFQEYRNALDLGVQLVLHFCRRRICRYIV